MTFFRGLLATTLALSLCGAASAQTATPPAVVRPDQLAFKALYKELVEINTTLSVGSCTQAATAMKAACTQPSCT